MGAVTMVNLRCMNLQKSFDYLVNDWSGGQGKGISDIKPVLEKGTNG